MAVCSAAINLSALPDKQIPLDNGLQKIEHHAPLFFDDSRRFGRNPCSLALFLVLLHHSLSLRILVVIFIILLILILIILVLCQPHRYLILSSSLLPLADKQNPTFVASALGHSKELAAGSFPSYPFSLSSSVFPLSDLIFS